MDNMCEKCIHKEVCSNRNRVEEAFGIIERLLRGRRVQAELLIDCQDYTSKAYLDGYKDGMRDSQTKAPNGKTIAEIMKPIYEGCDWAQSGGNQND